MLIFLAHPYNEVEAIPAGITPSQVEVFWVRPHGRGTRYKGTPGIPVPQTGSHKGPLPAPHHSSPYGLTSTLLKNLYLRGYHPTPERHTCRGYAHIYTGVFSYTS